MNIDKRHHPRARCEIDSSFKNLDRAEAASPAETMVQDISESGIRFYANEFIPIHHKLLFRIHIPGRKSIQAVAQPAWIKEVPQVGQYNIGAKFLSLSDEDREIIRQFTTRLPIA